MKKIIGVLIITILLIGTFSMSIIHVGLLITIVGYLASIASASLLLFGLHLTGYNKVKSNEK